MKTLQAALRNSPTQAGDDDIKERMTGLSNGDFKALDSLIDTLLSSYPLDQIYKVYHQNFS